MDFKSVFTGLTRGVPDVSPRSMNAAAATFEDADNIAAAASLKFSPDKIFMGTIGAVIERDENTGDRYAQGGVEIGIADDRHMITIAGSRAGKGRAAILPNILRYRGSVIAIDPKAELARLSSITRSSGLHQHTVIVDPFGISGDDVKHLRAGFNPMSILHVDSPTLVVDCGLIADALIIPSGGDSHWDDASRSFTEGLLLHCVAWPDYEGRRNLVAVRELMTKGAAVRHGEDIITGMRGLRLEMEACAAFLYAESESEIDEAERFRKEELASLIEGAAADFFDKPDNERGSVLSTARRHLKFLDYPQLRQSLAPDEQEKEFQLTQLKTEPQGMTVYLCLPAGRMGTCARWFRLFINLALEAMERVQSPPATGCPVLFVLDEFATLGHMRQIEDAAGQIAGFGVKLWPILQDLGQLKALYKDRWETFMGNAGILQFFGNNDLTTLEWVSKRLGTTTIEQLSSSRVGPKARESGTMGAGESYAPRTVPILEPDEIAMVFGRADPQLRQLIIRAGYAPMILQRAYYDKHTAFQGV